MAQDVQHDVQLVESKVLRIGGTLYVRIPAAEAKRLGIREGTLVDLDVRPRGRTVKDLADLRGRYPGLAKHADEDLWGDF